jgi:2-oxoglutarate ferredoxin oxidoreductase subunit alpha
MAFELAEKYRTVVVVLIDGSIGQMMEPAELPPLHPVRQEKPDWAVTGAKDRERRILSSFYLNPDEEEVVNIRLVQRWNQIEANEVRFKEYYLDDAEIVIIGFGTAGRVALSAIRDAREEGIRVGLLRPITLNPFPFSRITDLQNQAKSILVVEMNSGQMLDDVIKAIGSQVPVEFYGRMGGVVPFPDEVYDEIVRIVENPPSLGLNPRAEWIERLTTSIN